MKNGMNLLFLLVVFSLVLMTCDKEDVPCSANDFVGFYTGPAPCTLLVNLTSIRITSTSSTTIKAEFNPDTTSEFIPGGPSLGHFQISYQDGACIATWAFWFPGHTITLINDNQIRYSRNRDPSCSAIFTRN